MRAERTRGREELLRHRRFAELSPEVGVLDERALRAGLDEDPDEVLALLATMTTATDEELRRHVLRLAPRIVIDRTRSGRPRRRGVGRPRRASAARGGDLDVDASLDAVAAARAEGRLPSLDELTARDWSRPELAVCLLVDRSGSMSGARLAAAAVTAAACALRAPAENAVVAFAQRPVVIKSLVSPVQPESVVEKVLQLQGHGMTGLAAALRMAATELEGARARRRVVVLLSDCRATDEEDPVPQARSVEELVVLAPASDDEQARAFATQVGARIGLVEHLLATPYVLEELLGS